VDTVSVNRAGHLWQFGVDYRSLAPRVETRPYSVLAQYVDLATVGQATPIVLMSAQSQPVSMAFGNFSAFAQDAWKVSGAVTLTYGLRWESNPPPRTQAAGAPLESVDLANPAAIRTAFDGRSLWPGGYRHLAPRAALALRLNRAGSLVLRAATGTFYDLGFGQALQGRPPLNATGSAEPISAVTAPLASSFQTPVTLDWHLALEASLGRSAALFAGYVGAAGRRLLLTEALAPAGQTPLNVATNLGRSVYHGLQTQVRTRLDGRVQALASFAWAHSIDNVSQDGSAVAPTEVAGNRGSSDYDVRRSISAELVYQVGRGWSLDGVLRARTGFPFHMLTAQAKRPDLVFGEPVWIAAPGAPGGRAINQAAFLPNPDGRQGNLGRNSISGPGMSQIDLALERQFRLAERLTALLRIEAFNALNHPNFGNPATTLGAAAGESTTMLNAFLGQGSPIAGLMPVLQIGGPRSAEIAVRIRF
jgi:hypothetical protein